MMYSPAKAEDMRWRLTLLAKMQDALKNKCPITAKEIGTMTAWLDNRIKTHDYSREDAFFLKERLSTPTLAG